MSEETAPVAEPTVIVAPEATPPIVTTVAPIAAALVSAVREKVAAARQGATSPAPATPAAQAPTAPPAQLPPEVTTLMQELRAMRDAAAAERAESMGNARLATLSAMGFTGTQAQAKWAPAVDPRSPEGEKALRQFKAENANLFAASTVPTHAEQMAAARASAATPGTGHPLYSRPDIKTRSVDHYFTPKNREVVRG